MKILLKKYRGKLKDFNFNQFVELPQVIEP